MKKMKRDLMIAAMAVGAFLFASCGAKNGSSKQLVLYYSQTGATEQVAQQIQQLLGADIEAIELENPYSGTYAETIDRVGKERQAGTLPKLKALKSDISKYDVIYLGYPIWYGTYAMPISSLVSEKPDNIVSGSRFTTAGNFLCRYLTGSGRLSDQRCAT